MCNGRSTTTPSTKKNEPSPSSSSSECLLIPTAVSAPEWTEIHIGDLSAQDLQTLKQDDPFLYYSIPSVQRAALKFQEPDVSGSSLEEPTTPVKRCTRVSFECHPDLLMEGLLADLEGDDDQNEMLLSGLIGLYVTPRQ
eukprot:scaffold273_cov138-Skeletonema_menzelii.AAC.2